MLKLTLMTVGLLVTNLVIPGLDAMAATAPTVVANGSVRRFYAQGVFDFKNGERPLGLNTSGPANKKKPEDRHDSGFDNMLFRREAARRAEEERQFYYFYPDRWPKTPKGKK
jgi:hypothetical protein